MPARYTFRDVTPTSPLRIPGADPATQPEGAPAGVWLVKHREGWCLSAVGFFTEDATSVATACGASVSLPWGISADLGALTCGVCQDAVGRPPSRHRAPAAAV